MQEIKNAEVANSNFLKSLVANLKILKYFR
jgi:hypothetical protein